MALEVRPARDRGCGSNGKTTTTQMVLSIIKERFQEGAWVGTEGNLNNELGVSLMLGNCVPNIRPRALKSA